MDTWDAIRARRNVRAYSDRPIDEGDLKRILEAGWLAPSANNRQHRDFVVSTDRHQLDRLAEVWQWGRHVASSAATVVVVIPASTSAQASVFRPEVVIAGRETKILIDQVRTIDVSYVTGELIDYLSQDDMAQVEHSLSRYFGLLR